MLPRPRHRATWRLAGGESAGAAWGPVSGLPQFPLGFRKPTQIWTRSWTWQSGCKWVLFCLPLIQRTSPYSGAPLRPELFPSFSPQNGTSIRSLWGTAQLFKHPCSSWKWSSSSAVSLDWHSLDLADAIKISRNPNVHAIRLCVDAPRWHQDVLLLNTLKNLLR